MSVKLKIILFITIIISLSLGLTVYYLSNEQYKPAIKREIIDRIIINLDSFDRAVGNYLKSQSSLDDLQITFRKFLDVHSELIYVKIAGFRKQAGSLLYKKDLFLISLEGKSFSSSSWEMRQYPQRFIPWEKINYTNIFNEKRDLYMANDYKDQLKRWTDRLNTMRSNLSTRLRWEENLIRSNDMVRSSRIGPKDKQGRGKELLTLLGAREKRSAGEMGLLKTESGRLQQYLEQNMNVLFRDLNKANNSSIIQKYSSRNNKIISQLESVSVLLKASLSRKKIKGWDDLKRDVHSLKQLEKKLVRALKDLALMYRKLDLFLEIQLDLPGTGKKQKEIFQTLKLFKIYQTVDWYSKVIGYYEIGISEEGIMNKVTPILYKGIHSSVVIILISVILGLFLSLYIIYPIHRLDKDADNILRDIQYRIKVKRNDEFGKFQSTFNNLADKITTELLKYEKLYSEATRDVLTSLMVRRYFMDMLKSELENAAAAKRKTSLLMTDIDHFKNFNDTYGHQAGDEVLARVAGVLLKNSRKSSVFSDMVGRYGGEEFCMLLPDTDKKEALNVAERIKKNVEALKITIKEGSNLKVTISIGVTTASDSAITPEELISMADKALYQSKKTGRNKVTYG